MNCESKIWNRETKKPGLKTQDLVIQHKSVVRSFYSLFLFVVCHNSYNWKKKHHIICDNRSRPCHSDSAKYGRGSIEHRVEKHKQEHMVFSWYFIDCSSKKLKDKTWCCNMYSKTQYKTCNNKHIDKHTIFKIENRPQTFLKIRYSVVLLQHNIGSDSRE